MRIYIESAKLVKYNANSRGNNVGDCVKRSMSLAFDMSYNEIGKLLNAQLKKDYRAATWSEDRVWTQVVKQLGGIYHNLPKDQTVTVSEFTDEIAQPGKVYLVLCGKHADRSTHMVCVRDKVIYDSWDCSEWIVADYYEIPNTAPKEITDIEDHLADLSKEYASPIITEQIQSYMEKKSWEGQFKYQSRQIDYKVKYSCEVTIRSDEIVTKDRNYRFDIVLVFAPTMTEQDAIEYIKQTAKTRAYDRMYAIASQEQKLIEAARVRSKFSNTSNLGLNRVDRLFMTDQEERWIRSLPGWIQPLIYDVDIQNPGMYSDSYRLKIRKHPDDNLHPDEEFITFEGFQSGDVKQMIDRYKKTWEIPYTDYSPYEW